MNNNTDTREHTLRYLYYEDLHFIDPALKQDPYWAAQALYFAKHHSHRLVSLDDAKKYRDADAGRIDASKMKKFFDPATPNDPGGTAEYMATDWRGNPIHVHLNRIVDANMSKIPMNMYCRATDEFARLKQMKENQRILGRRKMMELINDFNRQIGWPPLRPGEDPFNYAKQMKQRLQDGSLKMNAKDLPTGLIDSIKATIEDDEDMALFNEFIYKGDVEIAIELGIKHFLAENKFSMVMDRVIADIRNFNRASLWYFTSATSGQPCFQYIDPSSLFVSPFQEPDGSDISHWWREWDMTFADFVRTIGTGMTKAQLKEIYEFNKHYNSYQEWDTMTAAARSAARIRVGYAEVQTQDCEVYAEGSTRGNLRFKKKPFGWQPPKNSPYKDTRIERHYNVWYKFYYLPLRAGEGTAAINANFDFQARFIYQFGKVQDQQRYGENDRFSRNSLVLYRNEGMSFSEVMDRFMPSIHKLWQKYQDLTSRNDVYQVFSNELMTSMMELTDDANKQGKNSKVEWLKMLRQTGTGVAPALNEGGEEIKAMSVYTVGFMKEAMEALNHIQALYNTMTISLGISDVREGLDPKPRTSLGGIQLAMNASNNATFFIETAYQDMYIESAKRILTYIVEIVKEDGERFSIFEDVIGQANGMLLETIKDIPLHRLGLHIENVDASAQMQKLMGFAEQLVKAQMMDVEVLNLLVKQDNYKYAAVLMIMKYKQKVKQLRAEHEADQQFQREMLDRQAELKHMEHVWRTEGHLQEIDREAMWNERAEQIEQRLKTQGQAVIRQMIADNKAELERQKREGVQPNDVQLPAQVQIRQYSEV